MSHPHGTYLGGIRTVADLRERCYVDDDSGCWHWRLGGSCGWPRVHIPHPKTGVKTAMRGRRAALVLLRGKDLNAGQIAFAIDACESKDCVNPAHCRSGTKATWGKSIAGTAAARTPAKVESARKAGIGRRKLTREHVELIRSRPDLSTFKLAEMIGHSQFAVWCVRAGKTWREPVNSIFRAAA